MPFCTSCGAEVAEDKKFCVQCGAPMDQVTAPVVPGTPAAPGIPKSPSAPAWASPAPPKKPNTTLIIGGIVVVLVIVAAVYFVGLPMLKGNQKSSAGFVPSTTPEVTSMVVVETLTPSYTTAIPETTPLVTTTTSAPVRDARLEEDYEQVYTINQKFAFGQKVNFAHELTRPPLYIRFNLTPVTITRHRLLNIGTNIEHYENTTETSPQAWFEVKVFDVGSGAMIDQQGFGNDYSDITKQSFMVRQKGNYRIEMSGNDVTADVQMLIGTP